MAAPSNQSRIEALEARLDALAGSDNPADQPIPNLILTKLEPRMPDPIELEHGVFELKLYAGDKDRYLMQNHRRDFSTRLKLDLPRGMILSIWPGPNMTSAIGDKNAKIISIDPSSLLVRTSTDELKIILRNNGFGAYHPSDWELSVIAVVIEAVPASMKLLDATKQETEQAA